MPRVVPPGSLRPRAAAARARHSADVDYARLHRHLIAADLASGSRVVVLGCGDGEGAAIIAETAASVVAVDPDPVILGGARSRHRAPGLTFLEHPEGAAGLPDGGFDLAVCFDAPAGRAAEGLVAEAARLLADRGLLLLSVDA
ncbi:MAG: class I SAM-dependent methyltransferase, partial [Chloroflexi bacterium]